MKFLHIDTSGLDSSIHSIITVRFYDSVTKTGEQFNTWTPGQTADEATLKYLGYTLDELNTEVVPCGDKQIRQFVKEKINYETVYVYNSVFTNDFMQRYAQNVRYVDVMSLVALLRSLGKLKTTSLKLVEVAEALGVERSLTKIEKLIEITNKLEGYICK